jgi:SAM-dependent methyltransferase
MDYATYTRDTAEPLKGFAHSKRFRQVIDFIAKPLPGDVVLDYGCADGHLFSYFLKLPREHLVGYDPDPKLLAQASHDVQAGAQLTTDIEDLVKRNSHAFSLIYCMEVCEHLTNKSLEELFRNVKALAAPSARIVIGVPIETGPSGFLKNVYRLAHGGRQNVTFGKCLRALVNAKIERRATDVEWFGSHVGFSHTVLAEMLKQHGFLVQRTCCLPFPKFGTVLNNEIYFVCSIQGIG